MPVLWERAALVATLLADLAATAGSAAIVVLLMAAARLVALASLYLSSVLVMTAVSRLLGKGSLEVCPVMAARRAAMAARRLAEMAASEDLAATVATAATRRYQWRLVALAAMPVLTERAAMAATELEVTAAEGAMAV